jgi:hypothetical protein
LVRNLASPTIDGYYHKQPIIELGCNPPSLALTTNLRRRSMKLVKKLVLPVLFVSVLAVNAYAGETETPGSPVPPPPNHSISYAPPDETSAAPTELTESTDELSGQLLYDAITAAILSMF